MGTLNKVTVIGRFGHDPEPIGESGTRFSLATDIPASDSREKGTEWIPCAAFGRTAEVISEHCRKGDLVYCEGRIQTRKYEDAKGQEKYSTNVVVIQVIFLASNPRQAAEDAAEPSGNRGPDESREEATNQRGQTRKPPEKVLDKPRR